MSWCSLKATIIEIVKIKLYVFSMLKMRRIGFPNVVP